MSAAWPAVADRLVVMFAAATPAPVFYGPPVTSAAPPDYVTVGYVEEDNGGQYAVESIYDGSATLETGTVVCQIVAQSGGTDLMACRARAFEIAAAIESAVRDDPGLGGVLSADGTSATTTDVQSIQNANGSAQALVLTVTYTTRH